MNAFKAFKACVPIAWSPHIYITLVRGMPGTRKLHRRTLEALRLRKCNRTVMRWNTYCQRDATAGLKSIAVKRLVVIEAEEMFKAHKTKTGNPSRSKPSIGYRPSTHTYTRFLPTVISMSFHSITFQWLDQYKYC
ncbi:hypothetical protein IFM89_022000 [Coptis chinensis]|uniref:Large ribosomal subunit protein uL30m n=1 Tax=Coptis chinensis TaxID=261450 RepID=A0A835LWP4_9MAGN|nr:hypothetical protein IFM89_022000 [Coptis chinensis]